MAASLGVKEAGKAARWAIETGPREASDAASADAVITRARLKWR